MGMPEIPDFNDLELELEDALNLILISIALEEMALAHIINAEAEKVQRFVMDEEATLEDLFEVNRSVQRTLRNVIKKEMLLQFKLEDALDFIEEEEIDEL